MPVLLKKKKRSSSPGLHLVKKKKKRSEEHCEQQACIKLLASLKLFSASLKREVWEYFFFILESYFLYLGGCSIDSALTLKTESSNTADRWVPRAQWIESQWLSGYLESRNLFQNLSGIFPNADIHIALKPVWTNLLESQAFLHPCEEIRVQWIWEICVVLNLKEKLSLAKMQQPVAVSFVYAYHYMWNCLPKPCLENLEHYLIAPGHCASSGPIIAEPSLFWHSVLILYM